ncbi:LacI family DNA-binding transcriptional regulator [Spirosoma foliorum]|uniref:LacI family DNA-binding transcriptional regulator n=1 Tax=Spirosoma foliorum TaxID=2710596 RepID=A0A7G5H5S5_9BACT|nr:LacI family DNA-binding transcriptional regulator [Spirosoma foliorum]QMW06467.1 LacI family DNA-binding transcriptional regulator [Spirosoma foliorum]
MKDTVTIKGIARQLAISPSTVSRALQDNPRISQKTREAVQKLATRLKYCPNTTARNLQRGKTGVFAVVLPEIRENFFSEVINGVEELVFANQYTVALYQSHDLFEREKQILAVLAANQVEGVLLSVAKESENFQHVQDLIDRGIPVVLFDRIPPKIETHQVGCAIEKGAYEATKWLAVQGFKRIALLNGPHPLVSSEERYRGYIKALLEDNLPIENALVKRVDLTTQDITEKMTQLLTSATPPDAVLAFNDYVALDAIKVCREYGLQINKDISFVSFSNLPLTAYLENPPLASIEQYPYQIGRKAAEILLSVTNQDMDLHGKRFHQIMLQPELVVRNLRG